MRKIMIAIGSWLILKLLSLRYKIEVKGLDTIQGNGGILFLPNHPAEIDPIIIYNLLAKTFKPRPLVIEHFYYLGGARFFMNIIRALPMPNFELSANSWKIHQVDKCLNKVEKEMGEGENFLIYPSGALKRKAHESIGGNSFIHKLVKTSPDMHVVLVRTTGLWGSSFSCAYSKESPDFWKVLGRGLKILLKNGIFFTPRRKVTIEFEENPAGFPKKGTRLELNQFLEEWYNKEDEPLTPVSYSCFREEISLLLEQKEKKREEKVPIPDPIREEVYRELTKLSGVKELTDEKDLSHDLGLDSLDLASIYTFIDQRFDIEGGRPGRLHTIYDILSLIVQGKKEEAKTPHEEVKDPWPKEPSRPPVLFPEGKTLTDAFLEVAARMGSHIACADGLTKSLTYKKLRLAIFVLAEKFKEFPGEYVAILLPSTSICYILILALLFAKKTPVVLNWTAGERSLKFSRDLLGFETILSSRRFLERVERLELGTLEEQILLMEDFRHTISLWDKLKGMFKRKGPTLQEDDPAVILFTSGTESYPKAVPLSHKNLLSNQKAALECAQVNEKDILYGALPPFHSFGFSVTGLLPLLAGLRVFYSPDPTDTHQMARECFEQRITLLCLAPTFYRNLFRIATPRQLKTVRLFVAGAEKTPPELFEHVKRLYNGMPKQDQELGICQSQRSRFSSLEAVPYPGDRGDAEGAKDGDAGAGKNQFVSMFGHKEMIEGYGITECSPIVTINRQGEEPRGVGHPVPGVELCVIEGGEIAIAGPNVFAGYLGKEAPNPFVEIDGKRWYKSGDLGHIDETGALILKGRIKRFVKIGGEMVSLVALEEELGRAAPKKREETPQLAIGVHEKDKPQLILFTTFSFTKEEANKALKEGGFPPLVKVAAAYQVDEIPMTGTGKLQLRAIQELVKEKHA
ncbi:AMP-binding protein [Candidatus Neptunochlamydia vexilliferae]|uniref:Bifunctional protein Aas n=1 Tax=Candidatus Neptunichlamydia vexilliferae TaxID=1651774 RepID=A0ABS0AYX2_9BACT|nr:AMP-binding protein [Candidatus Neptunochlamydia vexilliferae]MBF5059175.1 hypothetical protein [Candidatus Neptunochlamydia vexilliferae]